MHKKTSLRNRMAVATLTIALMLYLAVMPLAYAQSPANTSTTIQSTLCGIISTISSVIFIIAIFMFVLGAILYGVAHMFPAAGNLKGSTQGWGIGMIVGGIIAIILYLLSSFIITHLAALSSSSVIPSISQQGCSGSNILSGFGISSQSSSTQVSSLSPSKSSTQASSQSSSFSGSPPGAQVEYVRGIGGSTAGGNSNPQNNYASSGAGGVSLENGNFSSGSYSGWTASGPGFSGKPTEINIANQNGQYFKNPWSNYNGEFFATTFRPNSTYLPGNLTSKQFQVTHPFLNFNIISAKNSGLYMVIMLRNSSFIIQHYNTSNGKGISAPDTFANASINLSPLYGDNVSVRIVSQTNSSTSNGAFIAAGNFRQANNSIATPGILVNSTVI